MANYFACSRHVPRRGWRMKRPEQEIQTARGRIRSNGACCAGRRLRLALGNQTVPQRVRYLELFGRIRERSLLVRRVDAAEIAGRRRFDLGNAPAMQLGQEG